MKQHITKEQWNELEEYQKKYFFDIDDSTIGRFRNKHKDVTIGQMIEFLGDAWDWYVRENCIGMDSESMLPEKICDNLWEACKYKLNEIN